MPKLGCRNGGKLGGEKRWHSRSHQTLESAGLVVNPLCLLIRQSERVALNQISDGRAHKRNADQIDAEWRLPMFGHDCGFATKLHFGCSKNMSTTFKGQGRWVREILNKFTALDEFQPEPMNHDPEWPEWVYNLFLMLSGISHPGTKFKNLKKWKAKDLGKFLGRQYAGEHLMTGQVPVSAQVIRDCEKFIPWAKSHAERKRPDVDWDEFYKKNKPRQKIWESKFKEFMQETLSSACARPYVETSAFFEAFGKAIVMKPNEFETERTLGVGDKICWVMIVMWQEIEQLHSVAELHRMFEKALKPLGILVRYKRIEKLCQRIRLKFKDRGRPTGSKTQTNSPTL